MMDLIEFILKNQIVAEDWVDISESMPLLLGNHANLIRQGRNRRQQKGPAWNLL